MAAPPVPTAVAAVLADTLIADAGTPMPTGFFLSYQNHTGVNDGQPVLVNDHRIQIDFRNTRAS